MRPLKFWGLRRLLFFVRGRAATDPQFHSYNNSNQNSHFSPVNAEACKNRIADPEFRFDKYVLFFRIYLYLNVGIEGDKLPEIPAPMMITEDRRGISMEEEAESVLNVEFLEER